VLENSPLLAVAQPFGHQDDERAFDAPHEAPRPESKDLLLLVEGDRLHRSVGFGQEWLLAGGEDRGHVVKP
jgi:hypothetical protein